jgi:hypothetical protein
LHIDHGLPSAKLCRKQRSMTPSSPLRLALFIALLCAVSLRLLTPPGWMPNLDSRTAGPLVICTGDGVQRGQPADPAFHGHAGKGRPQVCAFAGLALDTAPQVADLATPLALPRAAARLLPADQNQRAPLRRRPQAARAPPLTA